MAPPEIGDCHLDSDYYALGLAPVTRMQGLSLLRGAPKTDQLLLDARKAGKKTSRLNNGIIGQLSECKRTVANGATTSRELDVRARSESS